METDLNQSRLETADIEHDEVELETRKVETDPNQSRPKKTLMRNPHDKVFAGVCGGIADYLQVNPNRVRLVAFVVLLLPTLGTGPFLYIMLWLFLPMGTQADGRMGDPLIQSKAKRRTAELDRRP